METLSAIDSNATTFVLDTYRQPYCGMITVCVLTKTKLFLLSKLFLTHKIYPAAPVSGSVELCTNVMGHEMGLWADLISDKTIHIIMKISQLTFTLDSQVKGMEEKARKIQYSTFSSNLNYL